MKIQKNSFAVLAFISLVSLNTPALAKNNGDHGNGHGKGKKSYHSDNDIENNETHHDHVNVFSGDSRTIIERYYHDHSYSDNSGGKGCPPGLAKKNPLCMPPGQYKKYLAGQHLPEGVMWHPLPDDLVYHLPPAPHGTHYGIVDKNVILMQDTTKLILDALYL